MWIDHLDSTSCVSGQCLAQTMAAVCHGGLQSEESNSSGAETDLCTAFAVDVQPNDQSSKSPGLGFKQYISLGPSRHSLFPTSGGHKKGYKKL